MIVGVARPTAPVSVGAPVHADTRGRFKRLEREHTLHGLHA